MCMFLTSCSLSLAIFVRNETTACLIGEGSGQQRNKNVSCSQTFEQGPATGLTWYILLSRSFGQIEH